MKQYTIPIILVAGIILVAACGYSSWQVSLIDAEMKAAELAAPPAEVEPIEIDEDVVMLVVYLLAIGAAIWFLAAMIKSGHGVALLVIGVAILAAWFFLAGDKTGDGIGDSQIIAVVQPAGNDPMNDAAYAEINDENAGANIKTAATFSIYAVTFVVSVLGLSLAFIIKPK